MKYIDIKDYLIERGWEFTEKEKAFFEKATGGLTTARPTKRPDLERGLLLYALTKRNHLKRALDIGTASWFSALCMAVGGAWVVTLDTTVKGPANWGMMNAYRDKAFQVVSRSQDYLYKRESMWDIIFVDGDHSYEGCKRDLELTKDKFNKFLVCHDYGNMPAVTKAIDEVMGKPDYLVVTDRRWYDGPYETKPLSDFDYGVAIYERT